MLSRTGVQRKSTSSTIRKRSCASAGSADASGDSRRFSVCITPAAAWMPKNIQMRGWFQPGSPRARPFSTQLLQRRSQCPRAAVVLPSCGAQALAAARDDSIARKQRAARSEQVFSERGTSSSSSASRLTPGCASRERRRLHGGSTQPWREDTREKIRPRGRRFGRETA